MRVTGGHGSVNISLWCSRWGNCPSLIALYNAIGQNVRPHSRCIGHFLKWSDYVRWPMAKWITAPLHKTPSTVGFWGTPGQGCMCIDAEFGCHSFYYTINIFAHFISCTTPIVWNVKWAWKCLPLMEPVMPDRQTDRQIVGQTDRRTDCGWWVSVHDDR